MTVVVAERVSDNPDGGNDEYFMQLACDRCDAWVWATELMAEAWGLGLLIVCEPCLGLVRMEARRAHLARYN